MDTHQDWFGLYRDDADYQFELLSIAVGEAIVQRMEALKLSRTELAKRMKVSQPRITQILAGDENLTLKTLVAVAHALASTVDISLEERDGPARNKPTAQGWDTPRLRTSRGGENSENKILAMAA